MATLAWGGEPQWGAQEAGKSANFIPGIAFSLSALVWYGDKPISAAVTD